MRTAEIPPHPHSLSWRVEGHVNSEPVNTTVSFPILCNLLSTKQPIIPHTIWSEPVMVSLNKLYVKKKCKNARGYHNAETFSYCQRNRGAATEATRIRILVCRQCQTAHYCAIDCKQSASLQCLSLTAALIGARLDYIASVQTCYRRRGISKPAPTAFCAHSALKTNCYVANRSRNCTFCRKLNRHVLRFSGKTKLLSYNM